MRLFTGIELPAEIKTRLARLLDTLRPTARIKWSPVDNLHVTTKFIGEWPDERVDELVAALRSLPPREKVHIAVRNLGWFPNPRSPRVFWAGLEAGPGLAELARETERSLVRLGVSAREPGVFAAPDFGAHQGARIAHGAARRGRDARGPRIWPVSGRSLLPLPEHVKANRF